MSVSVSLSLSSFINEEQNALLMTGSDDGIVRFWRNYDNENATELISSWRALNDLPLSARGSGLVTEWQQRKGNLIVSGDVRVLRVWDLEREMCVQVRKRKRLEKFFNPNIIKKKI